MPAWWRHRNTEEEKAAIKAGKKAAEIWPDKPAQKDTDARWTVKTSKSTVKRVLAIPEFGYKSHISIDKQHGFIRRQKVTDAAAHDGARLREGLIDPSNTASDVWAYRSKANEDFLADRGKNSRIHCRKPAGKPMPKRTAKARKSKVRAKIEHILGTPRFAQQKDRMKLVIRSIGLDRAEATIIIANIAYNMGRWRWWKGRAASA